MPVIRRRPSQISGDRAGAVEQLGLEGGHAAAGPQRDGAQRAAELHPLAVGGVVDRDEPGLAGRSGAARARAGRCCWPSGSTCAAACSSVLRAVLGPAPSSAPGRLVSSGPARVGRQGERQRVADGHGVVAAADGDRGQRLLQRLAASRARRAGWPSRVARSSQRVPLMPMTREGCSAGVPSGRATGIWQTSSVPKRPSRSVAVPPAAAQVGGDLGPDLAPEVAVARRGERPQLQRTLGSGEHHRLDVARSPRRPGAGARGPGTGSSRSAPRSTRPLGRRRGPRRRTGRRRRRLARRASSADSVAESPSVGSSCLGWPCGGTSRVLPVGLGLVGLLVGEPKPPVEP